MVPSRVKGFSFIEIMGALLIFSLLGTTLIISQGTMMRAISRIVQDVELFFEGRFALGEARRAGELYVSGDSESKTIEKAGRLIPFSLEIETQVFNKEGLFKDFIPGAYGRVVGKLPRGDQELFVFILGPNYIQPQDPGKKKKPILDKKDQKEASSGGVANTGRRAGGVR